VYSEKTREIAEIKAGTWDAKISGKDNVDDNEEPEAALKEATPPPATPPPEDVRLLALGFPSKRRLTWL
jgi:hypothetical protein